MLTIADDPLGHDTSQWLQCQAQEPGKGIPDSQVEFDACRNSIDLLFIQRHQSPGRC